MSKQPKEKQAGTNYYQIFKRGTLGAVAVAGGIGFLVGGPIGALTAMFFTTLAATALAVTAMILKGVADLCAFAYNAIAVFLKPVGAAIGAIIGVLGQGIKNVISKTIGAVGNAALAFMVVGSLATAAYIGLSYAGAALFGGSVVGVSAAATTVFGAMATPLIAIGGALGVAGGGILAALTGVGLLIGIGMALYGLYKAASYINNKFDISEKLFSGARYVGGKLSGFGTSVSNTFSNWFKSNNQADAGKAEAVEMQVLVEGQQTPENPNNLNGNSQKLSADGSNRQANAGGSVEGDEQMEDPFDNPEGAEKQAKDLELSAQNPSSVLLSSPSAYKPPVAPDAQVVVTRTQTLGAQPHRSQNGNEMAHVAEAQRGQEPGKSSVNSSPLASNSASPTVGGRD
jgi:hypothetical protein